MRTPTPLLLSIPFLFLIILLSTTTTTEAVQFTCNATATAACQGLIGYNATTATTYAAIQSLFQLPSLLPLLAANSLPLSTPSSSPVPAASTVKIPFPCACSNGTGVSDRTPIYTFRASDQGLDAVARYTFEQFVTYEEIGAANGVKDLDKIAAGTRLWIPLPCSCDPVGKAAATAHYGHIVEKGSSFEVIAAEFGTTAGTLMELNGIANPALLQAGQVIDVPLKTCSSSISSTALDHNLLVSNGSYALTAENCIQCSCSASNNYQLSCHATEGLKALKTSKCPAAKCGDLYIGNTTSSGCNAKTCTYAGYTNSTSLSIAASLISQTSCNGGSEPPVSPGGISPPSGSLANGLGLHRYWAGLLLLVHMAVLGM